MKPMEVKLRKKASTNNLVTVIFPSGSTDIMNLARAAMLKLYAACDIRVDYRLNIDLEQLAWEKQHEIHRN
jgi:hypothetical protein